MMIRMNNECDYFDGKIWIWIVLYQFVPEWWWWRPLNILYPARLLILPAGLGCLETNLLLIIIIIIITTIKIIFISIIVNINPSESITASKKDLPKDEVCKEKSKNGKKERKKQRTGRRRWETSHRLRWPNSPLKGSRIPWRTLLAVKTDVAPSINPCCRPQNCSSDSEIQQMALQFWKGLYGGSNQLFMKTGYDHHEGQDIYTYNLSVPKSRLWRVLATLLYSGFFSTTRTLLGNFITRPSSE